MEKLIICEGQNDSFFLDQLLKKYFHVTAGQIKSSAYNFSDEPPEEEIVILSCDGLDGIKTFLEKIGKLPKNKFHKVSSFIIWDQDPENQRSKDTKDNIKKYFTSINLYGEPFEIPEMLEGLIFNYLEKEIKNMDYDYLQEPLKCMKSYLTCLEAKNFHPKIRLALLEYGILLHQSKKYNQSRRNLDSEDKIIPKIFQHIDFDNASFKGIVQTLKDFIESN